jgi:hypothetical protein
MGGDFSLRKKIGTVIDEDLIFKAKETALLKKESLSQLLEDALQMYLQKIEGKKRRSKNIAKITHGIMEVPKSTLKAIMEEEGVYDA